MASGWQFEKHTFFPFSPALDGRHFQCILKELYSQPLFSFRLATLSLDKMYRQADTKLYHRRLCLKLHNSWDKKSRMTFSVYICPWHLAMLIPEDFLTLEGFIPSTLHFELETWNLVYLFQTPYWTILDILLSESVSEFPEMYQFGFLTCWKFKVVLFCSYSRLNLKLLP